VREILCEGRSQGWVPHSNGRKQKMSKAGWQAPWDATKTPRT